MNGDTGEVKGGDSAEKLESHHLNSGQLATKLGKSARYVCAMKAAGYRFEFATTTTLSHAENWLREHPNFQTIPYFRGGAANVRKVTAAV